MPEYRVDVLVSLNFVSPDRAIAQKELSRFLDEFQRNGTLLMYKCNYDSSCKRVIKFVADLEEVESSEGA